MNYRTQDMERAWADHEELESELEQYDENREITDNYIESLMGGSR